MRRIIVKTFNNNGYYVVSETKDVNDAVKACKGLKPDLVVIDAEMPYTYRTQAISLINSICAETRIVLLSALGPKVFIVEPVGYFPDDFIIEQPHINHPLLIIEREFSKNLYDYLDSLNSTTFSTPSRVG